MRGYPAHPPIDGESHLDDFIQYRFVTGRTPRAVILVAVDAFECGARIEDARTTRAKDVPRQLENPEPGGMKKRRDHALLITPRLRGEIQHIDAAELTIRGVVHQFFDSADCAGIGRLA